MKFGVEKIITVEYNNNFSVCVAYEWLYGGVWSIKKATEWKLCVMISRAKVEEKKKEREMFLFVFPMGKKGRWAPPISRCTRGRAVDGNLKSPNHLAVVRMTGGPGNRPSARIARTMWGACDYYYRLPPHAHVG